MRQGIQTATPRARRLSVEVFWDFSLNVQEKAQAELGLHLKHWLALFHHMYHPKKWVGLCQFLSGKESITFIFMPFKS